MTGKRYKETQDRFIFRLQVWIIYATIFELYQQCSRIAFFSNTINLFETAEVLQMNSLIPLKPF